MTFTQAIQDSPFLLCEGAVIERLRRDGGVQLDPHVLNAGFVYHAPGRRALERIYREYLAIGERFGLPMVIFAPTWRANPERTRRAGLGSCHELNVDGVRFVAGIRRQFGAYAEQVFVGGLLACRRDAYRAEEALTRKEAAEFHRQQAAALCESGADFVMAATLPAICEALGISEALARHATPHILSFVLGAGGCLLDGTSLGEAIMRIDGATEPRPLGYMVNCVHPRVMEEAMSRTADRSPDLAVRVVGLQANTSSLGPERLDGLDHLDEGDDPQTLADQMLQLHRRFGIKILGGCCGTDHRHIECLAAGMHQALSADS